MLRTSSALLSFAVIAAASLSGQAQAADIYRWVDASGRVHVSDVVPDKYRAAAKRIDSQRFELTPAQKAEAQSRKASRGRTADREPANVNQGDAGGGSASSLSGPSKTASAPQSPDCKVLWQQYADSQACFAPFKNVNGTMKPGANEVCTEVPDPSSQCGLPKVP